MKRASTFLLLGALALFSSISFATVLGDYSNKGAASAACNSWIASYNSQNNTDHVCYVTPNEIVGYAKAINTYYWNYSDCSPYKIASGDFCITPPTDEECQNTTFTASMTIDVNSGSAPNTADFGGCSYSITYDVATDADVEKNCKFNATTPDIIICPANAQGTGTSTNSDSSFMSDIVPVGDYVSSTEAEQITTETTSPTTTTTDSPEVGDTSESYTYTEAVTTSRKDEIYNNQNGIDLTSYSGNTTTQSTQTDTTTKANGDTITAKTESYDETSETIEKTHIAPDGSKSSTTEQTAPKSGSTTTVINNYVDGSTNTTTTNTGSGGTGEYNPDIAEGNCAPGQECIVKLDGEGLEDINTTNSKIDSIKGDISTKEGELIASITDNEGNNYGIDGVTDFSSSAFIAKYFSMPSPTCSGGINTTIFGRPFVIEPCVKLQPLRDVLSWVFFMLTAFAVIKISFRKVV